MSIRALLPPVARLPLALANLDRQAQRRWSRRSFPRHRPSRSILRQAGAVPLDAAGHRRTEGRARTRKLAGSRHADESADGDRHHRGWCSAAKIDTLFESFGEPVAAARSRRCIAPTVPTDEGLKARRCKSAARGRSSAVSRAISRTCSSPRGSPSAWRRKLRRLRSFRWSRRFARSVRMEMDFRLEAAAASEYAENSRDDPDIRAPTIDWDRTTREVMTMEWIDGNADRRSRTLAALGFDPARARAGV